MQIREKIFDFNRHTYIMGILNVTPDSFSDGGSYRQLDQALRHAEQMMEEGVDIIDIGGESTRPFYTKISDHEEIERTAPVIEALRARLNVPLSIDTYKPVVAKAALSAGVDLINDIWGLKYDADMAAEIGKYDAFCCLMHNRREAVYDDFMKDIMKDLEETVRLAKNAGIREDRIILDPGVGFGKTYEMNLEVLRNLKDFCERFPYPMLLGTSRKSVIGNALNLPVDQREEGTAATTVMAVMSGFAFVRVHDVKANRRAIQMTEAILRG